MEREFKPISLILLLLLVASQCLCWGLFLLFSRKVSPWSWKYPCSLVFHSSWYSCSFIIHSYSCGVHCPWCHSFDCIRWLGSRDLPARNTNTLSPGHVSRGVKGKIGQWYSGIIRGDTLIEWISFYVLLSLFHF